MSDDEIVQLLLKEFGFARTLKLLKKGGVPRQPADRYEMQTVTEGVLQQRGDYFEAALTTNKGTVCLAGARLNDVQWTGVPSEAAEEVSEQTPDYLLARLHEAGINAPVELLFDIEVTRFPQSQQPTLIALLWQYITGNRNSSNRDHLAGVAAAIRKYLAILPMEQLGEVTGLLESGNRSPLPVDLEIEVFKMIFRNYEVHPPVATNLNPALAEQLLDIAKLYANPRLLLQSKYSAAASLAIEAMVSMRSNLTEEALSIAADSPYRWFTEIVVDDLNGLRDVWQKRNAEAAGWLQDILEVVLAATAPR